MTTYTEKWVAGATAGWAALFGSEINTTIANGNAIISSVAVTNGSNNDIFFDISYIAGGTVTTAAPNLLGFYLYPLLQDGSTYGDGRFGSSAAGPPPGNYFLDNMYFNAAASTTISGGILRLVMPPGTWKAVLYNGSGASLYNGTNNCYYRSYNRSIS